LATLLAALALGLGLFFRACAHAKQRSHDLPRWLPIMAGAACGLATVVLWQAMSAQDRGRLERTIQFESAAVQRELTEKVPAEISELLRAGWQWIKNQRLDREEFPGGAALFVTDHPGWLVLGTVGRGGKG